MQTFITREDYTDTASDLDVKRLGKQRVEAYQILKALRGSSFSDVLSLTLYTVHCLDRMLMLI